MWSTERAAEADPGPPSWSTLGSMVLVTWEAGYTFDCVKQAVFVLMLLFRVRYRAFKV